MREVLAFDIWGQYGHFKKIYTTTSPLTYSIPPRTALSGLIGAILGLDKNDYLNYFSKSQADIAVQVLKPVKKVTVSENLIDTKTAGPMMNRIKQRTQIRVEMLKDPKYRVYVRHSDPELMERLTWFIEEHKTVYTPCLGLSEHIANFSMSGVYRAENYQDEGLNRVCTAIPERKIREMDFETDYEYVQESLPNEMNSDRVVTEYVSVILEQKTRSINASVEDLVRLENGDNIVFL